MQKIIAVLLALCASPAYAGVVNQGASLPSTCTTGDRFYLTAAPYGMHYCTGTDTWSMEGGGSPALKDEGVTVGTMSSLDCVGEGITCSVANWAGTITVIGGGGGGGAPTDAQYWTAAANGGLSAEHSLSGFTGLVLNTAGTPSAYASARAARPRAPA
jgi:hypothetical protein